MYVWQLEASFPSETNKGSRFEGTSRQLFPMRTAVSHRIQPQINCQSLHSSFWSMLLTSHSHYSQPPRVLWRGPKYLTICNLTNKVTLWAAKNNLRLWKQFPVGTVFSWKRKERPRTTEEENVKFKDNNDLSPATLALCWKFVARGRVGEWM